MPYAEDTKVPVERSLGEIRALVEKSGATKWAHIQGGDRELIQFEMAGRIVRFWLPVPSIEDFRFDRAHRRRTVGAQRNAHAQRLRSLWRSLLLTIKAKLDAVESGIESFDEGFLAHIVVPGDQTVGEDVLPKLEEAYRTGELPELMPPARLELEAGA